MLRPAIEPRVQLDEREQVLAPLEGREAVAIDPDDLGRDALANLGLVPRLGEDHQPAMAVQVDEAGRDDPVGGIDSPSDVLGERRVHGEQPHPVALDDDRAGPGGGARAVHDRPARDREVDAVTHACRFGLPSVHVATVSDNDTADRTHECPTVGLERRSVRPMHQSDWRSRPVVRSDRVAHRIY